MDVQSPDKTCSVNANDRRDVTFSVRGSVVVGLADLFMDRTVVILLAKRVGCVEDSLLNLAGLVRVSRRREMGGAMRFLVEDVDVVDLVVAVANFVRYMLGMMLHVGVRHVVNVFVA
jgi:hypothetical protein